MSFLLYHKTETVFFLPVLKSLERFNLNTVVLKTEVILAMLGDSFWLSFWEILLASDG
jgi:hypothetical protein